MVLIKIKEDDNNDNKGKGFRPLTGIMVLINLE